jgi:RNA polymerase sigma-70 factor, ECF subfamily
VLSSRPVAGPAGKAVREAIVLREMNNLLYQEIAQVAGVPVGTVMSRPTRARILLRGAWNAAETATTRPGPAVASGTAS